MTICHPASLRGCHWVRCRVFSWDQWQNSALWGAEVGKKRSPATCGDTRTHKVLKYVEHLLVAMIFLHFKATLEGNFATFFNMGGGTKGGWYCDLYQDSVSSLRLKVRRVHVNKTMSCFSFFQVRFNPINCQALFTVISWLCQWMDGWIDGWIER